MDIDEGEIGVDTLHLVSRKHHPTDTVVHVGQVLIGGPEKVYIAGPCSVEDQNQIEEIARAIQGSAHILRGGAYKPRTSPYSFQGLGEKGLCFLKDAGDKVGLPVITEVMSENEVDMVASHVDMLQVGARNMQNFALLRKVGAQDKPVLLKRGVAATIEELLLSAEYILAAGNTQVVLCERGIRTFNSTFTRNTLDLSAVPILKHLTHLPVVVDPSHGSGDWNLIEPLSKAALAAGAHGLMIEVHNNPEQALSDGPQSLKPEKYRALVTKLNRLVRCLEEEGK